LKNRSSQVVSRTPHVLKSISYEHVHSINNIHVQPPNYHMGFPVQQRTNCIYIAIERQWLPKARFTLWPSKSRGEAVGLSGQTLLRVQRNGLKIDNQSNIVSGAFGRALCEASKGQAQSPNPKEHLTLFLA
jgi:hypothetical protein